MKHIPHSTHDDETRFIILITKLIKKGELPSTNAWVSSVKDEKAKLVRKKQGEKEAKEAEDLARELGVWDEFYGSGNAGTRKGKGKAANAEAEGEEDHSALQALILGKKKEMHGFFDGLATKYASSDPPTTKSKSRKGKKRANATENDDWEEVEPRKKARGIPPPPDIDDEEFAKLQQTIFAKPRGDSGKAGKAGAGVSKGRKVK